MASIFLGVPTYLDRIENSGLVLALVHATTRHTVGLVTSSTSANCLGFNMLWLQALEARAQGYTHFCMVHSDVVPEDAFVDKMMDIMARTRADVLSAVIPIKDAKGLTSTALDEPVEGWDPRWRKRRLTMREVHKLEPTFTRPNLLVNTGLMLVDITKPWVENIHFHFDDDIIVHQGRRVAVCCSEDWNFSIDARALGAQLYATREVRVLHAGQATYSNSFAWGSWETDRAFEVPAETEDERAALDRMERIDGWFSREEGRLLFEAARRVRTDLAVVEIGSFKGRSTSVLAAARTHATGKVFAIDPHEGNVNLAEKVASLDDFRRNVAGLPNVVPVVQRSHEVDWQQPIGMLLIDGLHDYESVARDYGHFERWIEPAGLVAFHDYEPNYPGVVRLVDELVSKGSIAMLGRVGSLFVGVRPAL